MTNRTPEFEAALTLLAKSRRWDELDTHDVLTLTAALFEYYVRRLIVAAEGR